MHLAGSAAGSRRELTRANVLATRNLMEAVVQMELPAAVIVFGSAAEYGNPLTERIAEDHPLRPVTEYGRAKAEQTSLARHIASVAGTRLCIVRPFNIVSSDLPRSVALGNMRRQLIAGATRRRTVRCGRLDVVRDFVSLQFVVHVLVRLLELPDWPAILNVCSGRGIQLGNLLEAMASVIGVELDPDDSIRGSLRSPPQIASWVTRPASPVSG